MCLNQKKRYRFYREYIPLSHPHEIRSLLSNTKDTLQEKMECSTRACCIVTTEVTLIWPTEPLSSRSLDVIDLKRSLCSGNRRIWVSGVPFMQYMIGNTMWIKRHKKRLGRCNVLGSSKKERHLGYHWSILNLLILINIDNSQSICLLPEADLASM
jgi:hypothetical protein